MIGIGLALLLTLVVARVTGLTEYVGLNGLNSLRDWINGFGVIAPIIFVIIYVGATVAFLPGAPLSLLAGLVFGAVWAPC